MSKILVVDDDHKIAMTVMIRLRREGFEVVTAHDGVSAVATALREKPDLIVLDISMPAGGGFSVAQKLADRAETTATPIIFMTASKEKGLGKTASQFNAVAFLEKPYDPETLVNTVHEALGTPRVTDERSVAL